MREILNSDARLHYKMQFLNGGVEMCFTARRPSMHNETERWAPLRSCSRYSAPSESRRYCPVQRSQAPFENVPF